jgi:hypothetical protein
MSMNWFGVLEAARKVGSRAEKDSVKVLPFTSFELAKEAGFKATSKSSPRDIASAWLGKFVRWGYALRINPVEESYQISRGRPTRIYMLTNWGIKVEPKKKSVRKTGGKKKTPSKKS